jgi:hypothetical protein
VGEWLAARVEGQLPTLRPVSAARVRADRRLLSFGIRRPGAERLAWARDVLAGKIKGTHHQAKTYADEAQRLAAFPEGVQLPLQVIRIGDVALAASPCEMFAETGLAIKAASPAAQTFVLGLANGYGGYLPPAAQHALGGYEAWPARSSFLAEPAEGLLRRTLGEMVRA